VTRTLFVIVGAGASHDGSSEWPSGTLRPPLVKELFDPRHQAILAGYPLAQTAAPEIRDALRPDQDGQAVSLERHLRETYRDSKDPYDRRRFHSIALYLQTLLWRASRTDQVHFDNTDRLVTRLVRGFEHVCFITLNYDTILDQALGKLNPIGDLEGYIAQERWSLIKLHGSVDWGFAPIDEASVDDPPANLVRRLKDEIYLADNPYEDQASGNLMPPRYAFPRTSFQAKLFPALTVPVGEEDEVVCPNSHQRFLDKRLAEAHELDLLIVGYSAYDRTVIERIGRSEKRIATLTVVNESQRAANAVVARLRDRIPRSLNGTQVEEADRPFGAWCRDLMDIFMARSPAAS
jgi:hypothetical protein